MHKILIPLGALAFLTACPGKSSCSDSDTAGCDTGDTTDTDTVDTDTDTGTPVFGITYNWDPTQLQISIDNATGATGFYLGIADTAAGSSGWFNEACDTGTNCHQFTGVSGTLDSVNTAGAVVLGSTTLFDDDGDGTGDVTGATGQDLVTYFVQVIGGDEDGNCYVWGEDTSYYAGTPPCTEIVPQ